MNTIGMYWTEEENNLLLAQEGDGFLNFAEFLKSKMRVYPRYRKLGALQREATKENGCDRIYFASEDGKGAYEIRLYGIPKPVVDDLCRRSGWRLNDYAVTRLSLKEYGAPLETAPSASPE